MPRARENPFAYVGQVLLNGMEIGCREKIEELNQTLSFSRDEEGNGYIIA